MSTSAYSEKLVSALHSEAAKNGGVFTYAMAVAFAEANALKHRSVIAKVKSEGIEYEPKPTKVTKQGEPVVRKAQFVESIQAALGVSVPSLEKVTKADLQKLVEAIEGAEMPEAS
jgi:hypothetical protein